MEPEVSDDDIYGDLEADIFYGDTKKSRLDNNVAQHSEYQTLLQENQTLKAKIKKLEKDNITYFNNMSALYLTAKNEIEKKNFTIKALSERLKQTTKIKTNISNKDAEEILSKCQEALQESQAHLTLSEIRNCLKDESVRSDWQKRRYKFGNMSMFFFREQGSFQRKEEVVFNKPKPATKDDTNSTAINIGQDGAQASHADPSELRLKLPGAHSNFGVSDRKNHLQSTSATHVMKEEEDVSRMSFNGMDEMGLPFSQNISHEHEPEKKRPRRSDRDTYHKSEDHRDRTNRRNSSDERFNGRTRSGSKERSPVNDRQRSSRRGDDDRGYLRKDYDSRKSDNGRRQQRNWNTNENRTRSGKSYKNDVKPSNSSTYIKHNRSRSKSK